MRSSVFCVIIVLFSLTLHAQDESVSDSTDTTSRSSRIIPVDSLTALDTTFLVNDSLRRASQNRRGDITTTVNYSANDSMFFDLKTQKLRLYGDTHVDYGEIVLESEFTEVNWVSQTIKSEFREDSLGKKIGKPIFIDRGKVYETSDILYDFKSRKAIIQGVITEQDGAIMHGSNVKKNEKNDMFITDARYTTCTLADPHFFIQSKRLKVIPGNKVITGPFHLKFREVPTPLAGPFGMFPQPKKKASGIIVPSYGEERIRGFFLQGGGYYFAISDYTDLRITGNIFSNGGHGLNVRNTYIKRYAFRGNMNFTYTKNLTGNLLGNNETNSYALRWNHTPQSYGNSRFSASVNYRTSNFNQNNNLAILNYNESIQAQYSSNISYSNKLQGTPYSLSSSARFTQNVQTQIVNVTLPDMTLNMNRIFPFKGLTRSSRSPLAKLSLNHTFAARNELTNAPRRGFSGLDVVNASDDSADTLVFNAQNLEKIYARSRLGARHTLPITTSMTVLKYFTFSPTFNYQEVWYGRELKYTDYDPDLGGIRVDTVEMFSRAGSWRSNASLNTRFYGLYNVNKLGIQAIRHVVTPSVSFSYNPDFGEPDKGVYKDVVIDENGNTRRLSKYEGFIYGSPPGGESQSMSFSLTNNLEMKVLDKTDSTRESFKKVKIFDNLSANSSYNFAADSFKLSDIRLSMRTNLFNNKLSISTNATLDPYVYEFISENENGTIRQRRLDRYAWNNARGLGSLKSVTTSINFSISGGESNDRNTNDRGGESDFDEFNSDTNDPFFQEQEEEVQEVLRDIQTNPDLYVDFNVPWSLRMALTLVRNKTGFAEATVRRNMTMSGSLALTDNTQITFNSGYDFERKEFTTTRLSLNRDLHCWTLSFDWVPFGTYQSYMIVIRAKSPILQDLKVQKRRSFFDFFN